MVALPPFLGLFFFFLEIPQGVETIDLFSMIVYGNGFLGVTISVSIVVGVMIFPSSMSLRSHSYIFFIGNHST
jgi:hypothetical protein